MKIKSFACATALLSAVAFSSCSNENEVVNNGDAAIGTRISFSIGIPKGDPVTYAIHDTEEWGIESLWLYEYDGAGKLLSVPTDIKTSLTGVGPTYTYVKNIAETDKGTRQFVLVANEAPDATITAGTQMDALKAILAKKALEADGSSKSLLNAVNSKQRIPMTGVALIGRDFLIPVTGAPADVSVEMTRIVARIDIDNQVPNLLVTSVKLRNANSHSHLFLKGDYTVPASSAKVGGITTFTDVPVPFDFNKQLAKAFYLYEGHQPDEAGATRVEIAGTLGGVPVFYSIPFWKDGQEVVVKRNHIYRITLGDGKTPVEPGTIVTFTIKDDDWNEVTMNETFNIISATHAGAGTYTPATNILEVDNAAHDNITFDFATKFKAHTAFAVNIPNAPTWLKATFSGSVLTVKVEANATGVARDIVIEVNSDADPATKYSIKLNQAL